MAMKKMILTAVAFAMLTVIASPVGAQTATQKECSNRCIQWFKVELEDQAKLWFKSKTEGYRLDWEKVITEHKVSAVCKQTCNVDDVEATRYFR